MKKIQATLKEIAGAINSKGRERITVMFVPHSQKKIRSFHVSYYAIAALFGCIGLLIFISFSLLTGVSMRENEQVFLSRKNAQTRYQIDVMRESVQSFTARNAYRNDMQQIFVLGGLLKKGEQILAMGGREELVSNEAAAEAELADIETAVSEIGLGKQYLEKINQTLKSRKNFVDAMPTLWPVAIGSGTIARGYSDKERYADRGVLIHAVPGTPVRATASGTAVYCDYIGNEGYKVVVSHPYGFSTVYRGLSKADIKPPKQLNRGEIIGYSGGHGGKYPSQLRYQVLVASSFVDPEFLMIGK